MEEQERHYAEMACLLINKLFLRIPIATGPRTRTEAAKIWVEMLQAEDVPVVFDEPNGVFVVAEELPGAVPAESGPENLEPAPAPGRNGDSGFRRIGFPVQDDPIK